MSHQSGDEQPRVDDVGTGAEAELGYTGELYLALLALTPLIYLGVDYLLFTWGVARDGSPLLSSIVALVFAGRLALKDVDVVRGNGQTPAAALWVLLSPVAYLIARTLKTNSSPLWPLLGIGLTVLAFISPFTGDVTADSEAIERAIESDVEEQIDRDTRVRCDDVPATASVGDTITCIVTADGADASTATVEFTDDGGYTWSLS